MSSRIYLVALFLISATALSAPLQPISDGHRRELAGLIHAEPTRAWYSRLQSQEQKAECDTIDACLEVWDSQSQGYQSVPFTFILPKSTEPVPLIVYFPTIKGMTPLESRAGKIFCQNGIATVFAAVNNFSYSQGAQGLPDLNHKTLFGARAALSLLAFLETHPRFDSTRTQFAPLDLNRIGILGASNGTVTAVLVASAVPKLKALELLVGVGNLPEVLARTNNNKVSLFREEQMAYYGFQSPDQLELKAREYLQVDPVQIGALIDPRIILQYETPSDDTVPFSTQGELWNNLGMPHFKVIHNPNHWSAIATTVLVGHRGLVKFFKSKLFP